MKEYLGIDLGSSTLNIYSSIKDEVIFSEPTCITYTNSRKEIFNIGLLADKFAERTASIYEVVYPVRNGIITDYYALYDLLLTVFHSLKVSHKEKRNLIFVLPSSSSKVNDEVIYSIGKKLGARKIYIERQAKISALGIRDDINSTQASLLCSIGSGVSDVGVLSSNVVISSSSAVIAGDTFDESIKRYMMQERHLLISRKSAEYIKIKIGSVYDVFQHKVVEVNGIDTTTSIPTSILVSSDEIKQILTPLVSYICLKITDALSSLPLELIGDIIKNGLVLTGGMSLLSGIRDALEKELNLPVRIARNPLRSVTNGLRVYTRYLKGIDK